MAAVRAARQPTRCCPLSARMATLTREPALKFRLFASVDRRAARDLRSLGKLAGTRRGKP